MDTLESGTDFGAYVVEGLIAGGGMGQVYAARHSVYGSAVALKVLHASLHSDEGWRARFNEEGLVGTQLKHPHVLAARELVQSEGRIALVLDLVSGGQTLERVMAREFPSGLPLVQGLQAFLGIVQGIDYLHGKGIVHGDLKPENVMISGDFRKPETWCPQVTDFGTVALIANPVMLDGRPAVVATPRYASPEHLLGVSEIEIRSDIFCLGLLLHFMLTGQHASGARSVREAAHFVLMPIPLLGLVDHPVSVQAMFESAVAGEPTDRYPNCRALALDVRAVLDAHGAKLDLEDLQADLATEVDEDRGEEGTQPPRQETAATRVHTDPDERDDSSIIDTDAPTEPGDDEVDPLDEATDPGGPGHLMSSMPVVPPEPDEEVERTAAVRRRPQAAPEAAGGVPVFVWIAGGVAVVIILLIVVFAWPG